MCFAGSHRATTRWVGSENLRAEDFIGVQSGMEVNWHQEMSLCGSKENQVGVRLVRGREKLQSSGRVCCEGISAGFGCGLRITAVRRMWKHPSMNSNVGFLTRFLNRFFASSADDRMENQAEIVPSFIISMVKELYYALNIVVLTSMF